MAVLTLKRCLDHDDYDDHPCQNIIKWICKGCWQGLCDEHRKAHQNSKKNANWINVNELTNEELMNGGYIER